MAVGLVDRPVRSRPPAPSRRGWRALRPPRPTRHGPAPETAVRELEQVEGARVLLEQARALVAAGWAQDAFYVVRGRPGETRSVSPFGLLLLSRSDVVGACLVGAVAHASAAVDRRERRGRAALAVDTLWESLQRDPAARADTGHPAARAARVRELARWNDEPGRSRQEVVELLDRAISCTMTPVAR